jgi:hypothetical protein
LPLPASVASKAWIGALRIARRTIV